MPAYILVKAEGGWNPEDPMVYQAGYPVDVKDHSRIGGMQVPPAFVQVYIPDADVAEVQVYCEEWWRYVDYELVAHDYDIDGHRIRVFAKPECVSVSGLGGLTREMVEAYLNTWNATVFSVAANEVVFDALVYDAVCSEGFWERDISSISFKEKAYTQATGIHRIEADYTDDPELCARPKAEIEDYIEQRGGTIEVHAASKVTFEIQRTAVLDWFEQNVKANVDDLYSRRKFYFPQDVIDEAPTDPQDPAYGTAEMTRQQAASRVHYRLDD